MRTNIRANKHDEMVRKRFFGSTASAKASKIDLFRMYGIRLAITTVSMVIFLFGSGSSSAQIATKTITSLNNTCDAAADIRGRDCVAAINHLCGDLGNQYFVGLPLEAKGTEYTVGCFQVTYKNYIDALFLGIEHPGCNASNVGQKLLHSDCIAAVHRWCKNEKKGLIGVVTGQNESGYVLFACAKELVYQHVPLSQLTALNSGCNNLGSSQSLSCVSAAHRWCVSRQLGNIGLPQEVSTTGFEIGCTNSIVPLFQANTVDLRRSEKELKTKFDLVMERVCPDGMAVERIKFHHEIHHNLTFEESVGLVCRGDVQIVLSGSQDCTFGPFVSKASNVTSLQSSPGSVITGVRFRHAMDQNDTASEEYSIRTCNVKFPMSLSRSFTNDSVTDRSKFRLDTEFGCIPPPSVAGRKSPISGSLVELGFSHNPGELQTFEENVHVTCEEWLG